MLSLKKFLRDYANFVSKIRIFFVWFIPETPTIYYYFFVVKIHATKFKISPKLDQNTKMQNCSSGLNLPRTFLKFPSDFFITKKNLLPLHIFFQKFSKSLLRLPQNFLELICTSYELHISFKKAFFFLFSCSTNIFQIPLKCLNKFLKIFVNFSYNSAQLSVI